MTMLLEGKTGAKRQALHHDRLVKMVSGVVQSVPENGDPFSERYARKFQTLVEKHPDRLEIIDAIFSYYWTNAVARVVKRPLSAEEKATRMAEQVQRVERIRAEAVTRRDQQLQIMFLEMTMANGKTLRECTKLELMNLIGVQGRVVRGIIKALKRPSTKVGSVFTSNDELLKFIPKAKRPMLE